MRRVSTIVEILKSPEHSEGKPSEPPFAGGLLPPFPPPAAYAACTGGLQERLATRLVSTSVAGLYTDQHDKPHLDP